MFNLSVQVDWIYRVPTVDTQHEKAHQEHTEPKGVSCCHWHFRPASSASWVSRALWNDRVRGPMMILQSRARLMDYPKHKYGKPKYIRRLHLLWQIAAGTGGVVMLIVILASLLSVRKVLVLEPAVVFRG